MKSIKLMTLMLCFVFCKIQLNGQKAIYGNGNIDTDTRIVKMFTKLNIEINGDIIIHIGQQPKIIVETDRNILSNVSTFVNNNELLIKQIGWPEPSKKFIVHVYSPVITQIKSNSWSNIDFQNVNQKKLKLYVELGSLIVTGSVDELILESEQAKLDLKNLNVGTASVKLSGYADLIMCCVEKITKEINDRAEFNILTDKKPVLKSETKRKTKYINFEIVNNSWTRNHFIVEGPKDRKFSYGFPMNPLFSRPERWPIGTKVYKVNVLGEKNLLIEIEEKDENMKLKLFQD